MAPTTRARTIFRMPPSERDAHRRDCRTPHDPLYGGSPAAVCGITKSYKREANLLNGLYPARELGRGPDVACGGQREKAFSLGFRNAGKTVDETLQRLARDALSARELLQLLVGARHAVSPHD